MSNQFRVDYSFKLDGTLPEQIIGQWSYNNIRYTDGTRLRVETEEKKKLQDPINKAVMESKNNGLTINWMKTECMVVDKRKATLRTVYWKFQNWANV